MLAKLLMLLKGRKTTAAVLAMSVAQTLYTMGLIDQSTYEAVYRLGEALGLFGIRDAIARQDTTAPPQ